MAAAPQTRILVLNCGSTSLKCKLFAMPSEEVLAEGSIERIGSDRARVKLRTSAEAPVHHELPVPDHHAGIHHLLARLDKRGLGSPDAVAHKLAHGGERFTGAVVLDDAVLAELRALIPLAPLHNPPMIRGAEICRALLPEVPQYGVFETAFHTTLPDYAFIYALPWEWYERHCIRRYGFHSASHRYITARAAALVGRPASELRLISCHLGGGSSVCAVRFGRSIDISSGFTPQCGTVMATRPGDFDPNIIPYVIESLGLSPAAVSAAINQESGLKGVSGLSEDLRDLEAAAAAGHERARLAIDIHNHRVRHYIGAFAVALGGFDVLAFTGGIGENSPTVRAAVCRDMEFLGVRLDPERNAACRGTEADLTAAGWPVRVLAIPTDEEIIVARDVAALIGLHQ